jgi:hypothetical protein
VRGLELYVNELTVFIYGLCELPSNMIGFCSSGLLYKFTSVHLSYSITYKELILKYFHLAFFFFLRALQSCVGFGSSVCRWSFRRSTIFRGGFVSPTPNFQSEGQKTTLPPAPILLVIWHGWRYQEHTLPPA